jgi:hypothetical protein
MAHKPAIGSILALMSALGVFGPSWAAWRVVLKAIYALATSDVELQQYRTLTGRLSTPSKPCREVWMIIGRRGGKSMISALIAVYAATCRTYKLAPGERGVFMVIAADRNQARVVKGYIAALLHALPALERLIVNETSERIDLGGGLSVEIHTSSLRSLRSSSVCSRKINSSDL